ncbi:MAG: DNA polymerase IV [Chloroflexota bacterium]|nr:DNA polymerase IV [Chloroflexota bacterium]
MTERWIAHIDLDAFFANAEVLRRPELRGRPVIVGGKERGVVASATYEARGAGVRSAMPIVQARRLCPHAVVLAGDFPYYRELSGRFRAILHDLSPTVEVASIDEAYLDATGASRQPGPPVDLARALKTRLRAETGLTASVGLAPNKTVAKIASDFRKPDGLVVVRHGEEAAFLAPLPAGRLPGVGPKAQVRLAAVGIRTLGELAAAPAVLLRQIFGSGGPEVARRATGIDLRPLDPGGPAKSLGHETTFAKDVADPAILHRVARDLADRSATELRRKHLGGRIVALKLRHADFQTITRQRALAAATDQPRPIAEAAEALLAEALAATGWRRIRLVGVRVGGLGPLARQLDLFSPAPLREAKLSQALNALEARFGRQVVRRAATLAPSDQLDEP